MDTLTHGLAGALLARSFPADDGTPLGRSLRRREVWLGFAAAMFPDADALLSPFSAEFYITQHRGLSHSFLLLPLWALLLAVPAMLWLPKAPAPEVARARSRLALVSGAGVASHILLDWITSWGTMFLSPFSWRRFTLDWVFIVDAAMSGLIVLGLAGGMVVAWRRGDRRGRWAARWAAVATALYIGFCAVRHADAMAEANRLFHEPARARAAIPQPLSPDRWLLLDDDGQRITSAFVDLSKRGTPPPQAPPAALLDEIAASRRGLSLLVGRLGDLYGPPERPALHVMPKSDGPLAGRTLAEGASGVFGRFARFPAAREQRTADGAVRVVLRDLRFGYLAGRLDPFTFEALYEPGGKLLSAGFPSERWRSSPPVAVSK